MNENERDFVEAAFWLDFTAETLPQYADTLKLIKEILREKLDPAKDAA